VILSAFDEADGNNEGDCRGNNDDDAFIDIERASQAPVAIIYLR
jgi:hypothetical protein